MAKAKKDKASQTAITKPVGGMAIATNWPVYEVQISRGWERQGALVTILIARRSPMSGKVASAMLLVDLGCLGVKSAQVRLFKDLTEYNAGFRTHAQHLQPMISADINLAAKIVYTALEYAGNLGFKPDPIYTQASHLLAGARPDASPTPVPTGASDGKPFYINGPNDNSQRVINQLIRAVGEGNFHIHLQNGPDSFDTFEEY